MKVLAPPKQTDKSFLNHFTQLAKASPVEAARTALLWRKRYFKLAKAYQQLLEQNP